ncbi:unnamed protein product [Fusarium venenatum]|uniref:Uncharacterized protein n=1 Tax=Fusarium venenatum TaxID=56646 RepID=A0A2L2TKJ6_9HYPO|nr:uncharacterized protein FVRRES_13628 [Fusarium venenatum]CEI41545.1 unnamed protein product [Fusarium venenatum]
MACQNVGSTNPDIAGLGIVIAFASQAGLSLVLSFWSLSLWGSARSSWMTDIGPLLLKGHSSPFELIEQLQQAVSRRSPESKTRRLLEILVPELKGQPLENHPLLFDLKDLVQQVVLRRLPESKARRLLEILMPLLKGNQDDDAISPSFWVEGVRWASKKRAIDKVLATISDVQIMNVYETVSFTRSGTTFHFLAQHFSRSSTTGLLPTTSDTSLRPSSSSASPISNNRFWAILSLVICAMKWLQVPAIYLGLKVFSLLAIYFTVLGHEKPEYRVWAIVPLAMAQYPLHLYMTIALRAGNESLLSGDSENAWGFGQIVALILYAATLLECIKGFSEYRKIVQLQSDLEESEVLQNC